MRRPFTQQSAAIGAWPKQRQAVLPIAGKPAGGIWTGLAVSALKVAPDPTQICHRGRRLWGSVKGAWPAWRHSDSSATRFAGSSMSAKHALCLVTQERLAINSTPSRGSTPAPRQQQRKLIWALLRRPQGRICRIPTLNAGLSLASPLRTGLFRAAPRFVTLDRLLARLHANRQELLIGARPPRDNRS